MNLGHEFGTSHNCAKLSLGHFTTASNGEMSGHQEGRLRHHDSIYIGGLMMIMMMMMMMMMD